MGNDSHKPAWLDQELYPFKSHFIDLTHGQMHYVDEGSGAVLLFVHGTPTWSFLYRHLINSLSAEYRCIAIDHLGFGLSEHPENFTGTPENHAQNLSEFIREMNLNNVTLVLHDFGGPIGLGAAIPNSERVRNIVLMNTWLWSLKTNRTAQKVDKIVNSRLGRFLYLYLNFSPRILIKQGFADKSKLSKIIHQHYIKPFPNKASRKPLLTIAQSLNGSSEWFQQQWEQLHHLADKNWLIVWGQKDGFLSTDFLKQWQARLPHAKVKSLNCGHLVPEESPGEALEAIRGWLQG
jgi:pimeloyl-ACP methyl ester carboxylesterase